MSGFIDRKSIRRTEFESALRLLVPPDGSRPDVRTLLARVRLSELVGSEAALERLQPLQRQRLQRLAQRMLVFGYSHEAICRVARTLFATRLHSKDVWRLWLLFIRDGESPEIPVDFGRVESRLSFAR
jgi:hypothetical protein